MSSPLARLISPNQLIPKEQINFKTWHSEHIQFDILDIGVKKKAAKAAFSHLPRRSAPGEQLPCPISLKTRILQNIALKIDFLAAQAAENKELSRKPQGEGGAPPGRHNPTQQGPKRP